MEGILAWFRVRLPIPERFNKSTSKGAWRSQATAGLSWFKEDAKPAIEKAFELVSLLADYGYPIEVLWTERPGFVVYEDEQQIVAEPFYDTPG
ncbi:hypothetical protein GB928_016755 [Shinella curvata]|uniref:Uncharacterized protein n=1 Tax=Shinella curvata TaxID=1817964 RepID=A0ABT8XGH3_9HYPH|nr:hypothetical protein [Shinella curvata]MCJ8053514.1 hypothetical protein [Shinella curvata]MDO6122846.1 hypothetical protein [Shinella curvata]